MINTATAVVPDGATSAPTNIVSSKQLRVANPPAHSLMVITPEAGVVAACPSDFAVGHLVTMFLVLFCD